MHGWVVPEAGVAWLADLRRDMRIGLRTLGRAPGFAAATILTMALGIGAAAAIFSVFEGVLLRPLPYPSADRIVHLYQLSESGARNRVSDPNYEDWRTGTQSFSAMAQYSALGPLPIAGAGEAQLARVTLVSREFFEVIGTRPVLGRGFRDDEQQPGGPAVAIVSAAFWRRWRGGAAPAGEVIRSGETSYTVIGAMPEGFDDPGGTSIWLAREVYPPNRSRTSHNALAVARLADGVRLEQAQAEISQLSRRLKAQYGEDTWMSDAAAVPILEVVTGTSAPTLRLLLAASLLLLVVSCTNVSNLLVARAAARRPEFAVQLAMGATAGRLGRQLLAETLVICLGGAAVGMGIASASVRLFVAFAPADVPRLDAVTVSWPAISGAIAVSMLAALALSLVTAAGARGARISDAIAERTRSGTGGRAQLRAREALMVTQVALTLVLLTGTALLGRSLVAALAVDPGYALDNSLVVGVTTANGDSPSAVTRQVAFQDTVVERLRQQPGVERVGLVSNFPIGVTSPRNGTFIEMTRPDEITTFEEFDPTDPVLKARSGSAEYRHVSADYFQAMGIPLLEGRLIDDHDGPDAPHVAVVSRSLAEAQWPGRSALGRWIQFGNMDGDLRPIRVVGVVGDVREVSPEARPEPMLYVSARQRPRQASRVWIIVRGPAAPLLADAARRIVREIDPDVPATVTTVEAALDAAFVGRRFTLWLVAAFGVTALVLATLGVYGLFAYAVSTRSREMGIRLALGAEPGGLIWLVVRRALVLTGAGTVIGLAIAQAASGIVTSLVYGIAPDDPVTLGAAGLAMAASTMTASYLASRPIFRQSPATALRNA
jgi:putative ABC transport system permease protein